MMRIDDDFQKINLLPAARVHPVEKVGLQKNQADDLDLAELAEKDSCRHKLNKFPGSNRLCCCSASIRDEDCRKQPADLPVFADKRGRHCNCYFDIGC
jgi:hypothetical protein